MSSPGVFTPFFPPATPYLIPYQPFDAMIAGVGLRLLWQKSHACPCIYAGQIPGSPDPNCLACSGYGWYWDQATCPFVGVVSFMHLSPSPDEPGADMSEKFGLYIRGEPTLTIPFSAPAQSLVAGGGQGDLLKDPNILLEPDIFNLTDATTPQQQVWEEASLNDIFTEIDALDRFTSQLVVGGIQTVPFGQQLTIAPQGAVTVYNTTTNQVLPVSGYTISGRTVTLPASYPAGTKYMVEYTAAKSYVAWRLAGAIAHQRPFGSGITLPKRFRIMILDMWLRNTGRV